MKRNIHITETSKGAKVRFDIPSISYAQIKHAEELARFSATKAEEGHGDPLGNVAEHLFTYYIAPGIAFALVDIKDNEETMTPGEIITGFADALSTAMASVILSVARSGEEMSVLRSLNSFVLRGTVMKLGDIIADQQTGEEDGGSQD